MTRQHPSSDVSAAAVTPSSAGLSIDVRTRLAGFSLHAAFDVEPGEVLVVIGPNGSGKSTLLRTIAGLHPPEQGRVRIGAVTVDAFDAVDDAPTGDNGHRTNRGRRVYVPTRQRHVGMVFQDYQLFEHLDVLDNVAFGPRCAGAGRRLSRDTARSWLDRFDLADHAALRPWQLSGGQQQRVALARALAESPSVLLLDEPLAALDVETKAGVRRELRTVLSSFGGACVIVTHDPIDVYAFADRVLVLDGGQVVQTGTLAELTAHPRSRFVAELVGTNLVTGQVSRDAAGTVLRTADGNDGNDGSTGSKGVSGPSLAVVADFIGPAFATVRPSSIALSRVLVDSSARNTLPGTITDIEQIGDRVRVTVDAAFAEAGVAASPPHSFQLVAEITLHALISLDLHAGDSVFATVKATDIVVYPA